MAKVTIQDVLGFTKPKDSFLCPLSANIYNIDFLSFQIRDYDTKRTIFEVNKENSPLPEGFDLSLLDESVYRKIKYDFSVDVLRLPRISTLLQFSVGNNEVEDFRMIERHYFRDRLVKSFDFEFGFCIPNSTNTWEAVYDVPPLDDDLVEEMLASPHETRSDSFYFVKGELVMHNMATYRYTQNSIEAQGKANADSGSSESASAGGKSSEGGAGAKFDDSDDEDDDGGRGFSYK